MLLGGQGEEILSRAGGHDAVRTVRAPGRRHSRSQAWRTGKLRPGVTEDSGVCLKCAGFEPGVRRPTLALGRGSLSEPGPQGPAGWHHHTRRAGLVPAAPREGLSSGNGKHSLWEEAQGPPEAAASEGHGAALGRSPGRLSCPEHAWLGSVPESNGSASLSFQVSAPPRHVGAGGAEGPLRAWLRLQVTPSLPLQRERLEGRAVSLCRPRAQMSGDSANSEW